MIFRAQLVGIPSDDQLDMFELFYIVELLASQYTVIQSRIANACFRIFIS